jgi:eukaryotic-like serine/threonine-protein kinase
MIQASSATTGCVVPVCVARVADSPVCAKQWELVECAARGSLAGVYRARPIGSAASRLAAYAVKMLRPCWQNDPEAIQLLRREALVGRSVSHAHLVPVLTASLSEPPHLLVMPWLEGASLQARLAAGQQFDVAGTLWIARQVAEALDALDRASWMHGDVTPGNICIAPTGHATLIDFSFARRREENASAADRPIMGSCSYIAPEYFTSAVRADIRSDLYSLGVVVFEMLTGHVPYPGRTLEELARQHRQAAAIEWRQWAGHIPREAVQLVRNLIAHDPLRRPQSPRELIDRLVSMEVDLLPSRAD